jgi:hypothetical protein
MTLEDFDKLDPDEYLNFSPLPKDSNPKAIDPVGTMVATINLALECGIQSVLPAVYLLTTSNTLVSQSCILSPLQHTNLEK